MNAKKLSARIVAIFSAATILGIAGYALLPKKISAPQKEPINLSISAQNGLKLTEHMARIPENPSWQDLNAAQRDALSPLGSEWDTLNAQRKQKWLHIAHKYFMMKPDQQQRAQKRMRAWVSMTADQQEVARENYARTLQIDSRKKALQWEQYQQLSDDQKQKLAKASKTKERITNLPLNAPLEAQGIPPFKSGLKDDHSMTAQVLPSER